MTEPEASVMSYGCQYGCGNPYHVILLQVQDGSVLFLCIPCFAKTAEEILKALIGEVPDAIDLEMGELAAMQQDQAPGPRARRGRHNAPAGTDSQDLIDAYDSAVYEDELPDEFQ